MFKLFALVFAAILAIAAAKPGYVGSAVAYSAPVAHYGYAASPYYSAGYASPYAYSGYGYGHGYGFHGYSSPYHYAY